MNRPIQPMWVGITCLLMMLPAALAEPPIKIVTFGDSLTAPRPNVETYTDQLRTRMAGNAIPLEFINRGVGGNDTNMAAQRFEKDVIAEKPQIVVMQFGINDSTVDVWKNPPQSQSRVSEAAFEKNLRHFIEHLTAAGSKVILMTPSQLRWTDQLRQLYGKPPYDPHDERGFDVTLSRYAGIMRRLAAEYQIPLIDMYARYDVWEKENHRSCSALLTDGMHPSTEGQRLVADLLEPEITRMARKLRPGSPAATSR